MLESMTRRTALFRKLALAWALLHVALPGAGAVADGLLMRASAGEQVAHVESTTTSSCPVVHAPDCGVCRYLSGCTSLSATGALPASIASASAGMDAGISVPPDRSVVLPDNRAPPLA